MRAQSASRSCSPALAGDWPQGLTESILVLGQVYLKPGSMHGFKMRDIVRILSSLLGALVLAGRDLPPTVVLELVGLPHLWQADERFSTPLLPPLTLSSRHSGRESTSAT